MEPIEGVFSSDVISSIEDVKDQPQNKAKLKMNLPLTPQMSVEQLPTLIIDNGGWTIKHALLKPNQGFFESSDEKPTHSQNLVAKPKHQLTTLYSSQINSIQNKSQLLITRPLERGYMVDLGTQLQVWNYILELENLNPRHSYSNYTSVMSGDFGKTITASKRSTPVHDGKTFTHSSAVFLLMQPFTPRCIIENEDECWFRDFGFTRVGRCLGACCSAFKYLQDGKRTERGLTECEDDNTGCCLVVDCGFSMTSIVPTFESHAIEKGIKRINIGGKLLTNLLKQIISYRKFNMMDEFFLVNEAKEILSFISMNFEGDMNEARGKREGTRYFDRDFLLPDFVDTFQGSVRLPEALIHLQRSSNKSSISKDMESHFVQDAIDTEAVIENDDSDDLDKVQDDEYDDSDDETEEQAKLRIMKQREEEQKRREQEQMEKQVLPFSVERFAVPEVLFRPSDIGMPQLGLAEAIVQSIEACPPIYRAPLYNNIILTGGTMKIPGIKERLERDLREIAPTNYKIRIYVPKDPVEYAWHGAKELIQTHNVGDSIFLNRLEWEKSKNTTTSTGALWNSKLNQGLDSGFIMI